MEPERSRLLRLFAAFTEKWSAQRELLRVNRGSAGKFPALTVPRLWLLVRGAHTVQFSDPATPAHLTAKIAAPTAVALASNAGWLPDDKSDYSLLGVVFHLGFTRVLHRQNKARQGRVAPQLFVHLTGPGHQRERALVQALFSDDQNSVIDTTILTALLHQVSQRLRTARMLDNRIDAHHYHAACAYLHAHFREPIDRTTVARSLHLHPNSLSRIFRRHGEESCNATLRRLRIDHACTLLHHTPTQSIAAVAAQCGYASADQCIRDFRRIHGQTPGTWRKRACE